MKYVFWSIFFSGILFCGAAFALIQTTDFIFLHQGVRFKSTQGVLIVEDLESLPQFHIEEVAADADLEGDATQLSESSSAGVPMAITPETEFDFGALNPLTNSLHRFVVTNGGAAPLKIRVGETTCKCTVGKVAKQNLAPGESTEVELRWNTGRDTEHYAHSALVYTNDPQRSTIQFRIHGRVLQRLVATPDNFAFPAVRPNRTYEQELVIRSQEFDTFDLGGIGSTLSGLQIDVQQLLGNDIENLAAKSGYRIKITLPTDMKTGAFNHMIRIPVLLPGNSEEEIVEIPLSGRVTKRIGAYGGNLDESGVVDMGKKSVGEERMTRVIIRVYDDEPDLKNVNIHVEPDF
ncbi:MAG: hypothetical protein ACI9G1_001682, partial [Pirellulaceae bacterium]